MPTAIGKCHKCWRPVSSTIPAGARYGYVTCPCGQAPTVRVDPITVKRGRKGCGEWCTDGTGKSCTCVCEGTNHGFTYRVR